MTERERADNQTLGRAIFDQEMAFFMEVAADAASQGDAEAAMAEVLLSINGAGPAEIRRAPDASLQLMQRLSLIGFFIVMERWDERHKNDGGSSS